MDRVLVVAASAVLCFAVINYWSSATSQQPSAPGLVRPAVCDQLKIDGQASNPLRTVALPPTQSCRTRTSNSFSIPDPNCTPGAINPTLTIAVLKDPSFTTTCRSFALRGWILNNPSSSGCLPEAPAVPARLERARPATIGNLAAPLKENASAHLYH
jgi:hypothetical protein